MSDLSDHTIKFPVINLSPEKSVNSPTTQYFYEKGNVLSTYIFISYECFTKISFGVQFMYV